MQIKTLSLASCLAVISAVNALPVSFNQNPFSLLFGQNTHQNDENDVIFKSPIQQHKNWEDSQDFSEKAFKELPEIDTDVLQALINEEGLRDGAESLYNASQHSLKKYGHPTRVIGSPGHWKTIDYILKEIRKLGGYYSVSTQKFKAVDGEVKSFSLLINGTLPKSTEALSLTPPTPHKKPVNGNLVLVANYGCSLEDFPANTAGSIVLVQRGECAFGAKSINAGLSGALGAIIFDKDPLRGTLGEPTGKEVPTVSITTADAQEYIDTLTKDPEAAIEVTLYIDGYVKRIAVLNVVAESKFGDHDNVVSLGAHSDSVSAGPGINDDGSGTVSLLQVAKYLANFQVNNAVRFAWWAAEEEGLLGSYYYANHLTPEENSKIRLFMDYDMMASPNYEYQIYDANNVDHPDGSGDLRDLYVDWYKSQGLNYTFVPFDGRSDYVGFIDNGIPAGGIATGAEGVKTPEGVEKFGGVAGEWFDPCYHQLCDDLSNPDYEAWVINTKLIAHTVATYAKSFEGFPERKANNATVNSMVDQFEYRGPTLVL